MELRLMTTENERRAFAERLARARAAHGAIFRKTRRLRAANELRLASSKVYALFEREEEPAERMIAGIVMHDLEAFPQSCSRPDLSCLPPRSVFECSDHWSLSKGAGLLAWCGLAIPVRRLEARAVLAYLAVGPTERAGFYTTMGFVEVGEPVEHPYVEALDGGKLWVQPMLLEGAALQRVATLLSGLCEESADDIRVIRFRDFESRATASHGFLPLSEVAAAVKAVANDGLHAEADAKAPF